MHKQRQPHPNNPRSGRRPGTWTPEAIFNGWRPGLVGHLSGHILEIGVGTGENLPYYRTAETVTGIEPDDRRAAQARTVAQALAHPVRIDVAPAEALPYADATFDHVVSSLVFCSVTDPIRALQEIRRVLKADGVLHMVEHVRPRNPLLAALFSAVTPAWSRVAYNCHLDRPTVDLMRSQGWQVQIHRRRAVFLRLTAYPSPH